MNTTTNTAEMTLTQHREALEILRLQNNDLVRILNNARRFPWLFPAGKADEFLAELDGVIAQARVHQDAIDRIRLEAAAVKRIQAVHDSSCDRCFTVHAGECW